MNQVVLVSYEIVTDEHHNTLSLLNNPADGCYSIAINAAGIDTDAGEKCGAIQGSVFFTGEYCSFDPDKIDTMNKCLKKNA